MVRVVRLERTVSWSQTRRDTNFAIPGYSLFCHDTTARGKNKAFSVCGHLCGQSRFCAAFGNRGKSSKRRCCKALRRFTMPRPGYRHGTPKCRALPVEPHPDIHFSAMIPRRTVKIKLFLSVVILHFSHPTMPRGKKQQEAGRFSARFLLLFCIVLSLSVLLDQRQRHVRTEQIRVNGQPEHAAHQLHKASHDGKPQPAALRVAGGVPAHKALHQLVG